jgi:hypothetical protein
MPTLDLKAIDDLIGTINDKSNSIKAKNANDIQQINQDFTNFLDLGRKLIQFCLNDKVCKCIHSFV